MDVERHDDVRKTQDWPAVDGENDVVQLQTWRFRRPSSDDVGNDCSPTSRQTQPRRERGCDVLSSQAERDALHVAGLAKIQIVKADDGRGNGKAQPFAA